jgi:spore protease
MKGIDLSKFAPRSDLADEVVTGSNDTKEYSVINKMYKDVNISYITIHRDNNSLNKKKGDYISIEFQNVEDQKNRDIVKEVLVDNLKTMINKFSLNNSSKVLVVGLGNENFMADALGPLSAKEVIVTSHIFEFDPESVQDGTKCVSLLIPGVMGQTGMETADIVKSVADFYKPNLIIFIDALASRSITRVNKVIQVCDTGIAPGSGVGNNRKPMDEEYLGAPCVAIGVATVVGASSIVDETISIIEKMYGDLPLNHSIFKDRNRYQVIADVLEEKGLNMIVTPKQIDEDVKNIAYIIRNSINESLHNESFYL